MCAQQSAAAVELTTEDSETAAADGGTTISGLVGLRPCFILHLSAHLPRLPRCPPPRRLGCAPPFASLALARLKAVRCLSSWVCERRRPLALGGHTGALGRRRWCLYACRRRLAAAHRCPSPRALQWTTSSSQVAAGALMLASCHGRSSRMRPPCTVGPRHSRTHAARSLPPGALAPAALAAPARLQ